MINPVESLSAEYLAYVKQATDKEQNIDWNKLLTVLSSEGEWTPHAAEHLMSIVQNYGSFFLKNAYALAIAANIEDGQLGL